MEFCVGHQAYLNDNPLFGDRVVTSVYGPQFTAHSPLLSQCKCAERTYWTPAFHSHRCRCTCQYCSQVRRRRCMCLAAQTMGMGEVNHLDCTCGPLCSCSCTGCTHHGNERPIHSTTSSDRSQLGTHQYVASLMLQRPFYREHPQVTPSPINYNPRCDLYEEDPHRNAWVNLTRGCFTRGSTRLQEVLKWAPEEDYLSDLIKRGTLCREAGCMEPVWTPDESGRRRLPAFPYCPSHRVKSKHLPAVAMCFCGEVADQFDNNRHACANCVHIQKNCRPKRK